MDKSKSRLTMPRVGEDVDQPELSYTAYKV